MWGGLTVYGIILAKTLQFKKKIFTALTAGMFIVTMDLLLDVVAIRLDGGFWIWVGNEINLSIDQHTFMSVIWVNFLGYMIETPTVVFLTLIKNDRIEETNHKKQLQSVLFITLVSIVITAIGSLLALLFNTLTNDWFACILFILIWLMMGIKIIIQIVKMKIVFFHPKNWDIPMIVFWFSMYAYCITALIYLKIYIWFIILGLIFAIGTLLLCVVKSKDIEGTRMAEE